MIMLKSSDIMEVKLYKYNYTKNDGKKIRIKYAFDKTILILNEICIKMVLITF